MKIVKLSSENVKRLKAVQIQPDGSLVVVGGKNGAGKTSVLDSIMYALAGGKSLPAMPVRQGQDHAEIVVDLGDIIVTRTFSKDGGSALTVKNRDGLKYPSPQAILDKLVGRLSFDPLEFARTSPPEQADTLRTLTGLDVSALEVEGKTAYDNRSVVNRTIKQVEGQLAGMPSIVPGLPEVEESSVPVLAEQEKAQAENQRVTALSSASDRALYEYQVAAKAAVEARDAVVAAEAALERARANFDAKTGERQNAAKKAEEARKRMEEAKPIDMAPFRERLYKIECFNRQIRANQQRWAVEQSLAKAIQERNALTLRIEKAAEAKRKKLAEAKYPIEGLALNEAGQVVLNGIPFEQCSSAEQLRVSVAIGLALNPKLRVLLIRDGSLLDADNLHLVAEMAAKSDGQVWLECVGDNGMVSVIIEDGTVAVKTPEPPTA